MTILTYHGPYGTYDVYLKKANYLKKDGPLAIQAICADDYSPAFTATVNLPEHSIAPDEAFVKDYGENQGVLAFLRENRIVTDIVRHIRSDYVSIPLCKIDLKRLDELL
jgi:hypothetical protein